ncbi:hypothetical protein CYMTET_33472, partial [Cymbomonas tetramitiformis]
LRTWGTTAPSKDAVAVRTAKGMAALQAADLGYDSPVKGRCGGVHGQGHGGAAGCGLGPGSAAGDGKDLAAGAGAAGPRCSPVLLLRHDTGRSCPPQIVCVHSEGILCLWPARNGLWQQKLTEDNMCTTSGLRKEKERQDARVRRRLVLPAAVAQGLAERWKSLRGPIAPRGSFLCVVGI